MLRAVCDAHGVLLIADEIYTGFNRTGALGNTKRTGPIVDCYARASSDAAVVFLREPSTVDHAPVAGGVTCAKR